MFKNLKNYFVFLEVLLVLLVSTQAHAFADAQITSATSTTLDGIAHHGLLVTTTGNSDPNLTFYEVNVHEDTGNPFYATWNVYDNGIMPYDDGSWISLPYRGKNMVLKTGVSYCVRIRAIYGSTYTNWSEECGVTLTVPSASTDDIDGDGLSEIDEYAQGTDPNDSDSDDDGSNDGEEIANGTDPNEVLYPNIMVRTANIDFGEGAPTGQYTNQHQYIEIENVGDDVALMTSISVQALSGFQGYLYRGSTSVFHVGTFPTELSNIPPNNVVRVPVSFIPTERGNFAAQIEIESSNNPNPIDPVPVEGVGVGSSNCDISPNSLDFGTVAVDDQAVAVHYVTIANATSLSLLGGGNPDMPFGFTVSSSVPEMAPGFRGFVLPIGDELEIPVYFRHSVTGTYEGTLTISSFYCGDQTVELRGVAE